MPAYPGHIDSKLPHVGTTIFTVMSRLAAETGKAVVHAPELCSDSPLSGMPWPADIGELPFLIVGGRAPALADVVPVLRVLFGESVPLFTCGSLEAELAKYTENAFLATKVTFANEMAEVAAHLGADWDVVRAAWLLDPADPQNAYRAIAFRSAQMSEEERTRALETLRSLERDLVMGARPPARTPFVNIAGIVDDAGGGMAFVPAGYARGFSLVLRGDLDMGVAALRTALATDPLVADAAMRLPTMSQGLAALRQGRVADAIEPLEATVAHAADSSEAHRMLATAYVVSGEIPKSLDHLREAVRLNARDERSWVALARTLDQTGRSLEAEQVVRDAVAALPDAGALRWQLAAFAARQQRTVEADVAPIVAIERYVLLAGRGDLYLSLAKFASTQLDYQRAIAVLEQAIALNVNNVAAHRNLARAYIDEGREAEGYAELVVAHHLHFGAQRLQVLHEVEGETVVVIDHQQHGAFASCTFKKGWTTAAVPPSSRTRLRRRAGSGQSPRGASPGPRHRW